MKNLELIEKNILIRYSAKDRFHPTGEIYNYSIGWRKFAFRIARRTRDFRLLRQKLQNNICPICSDELYEEHLHHITYKHECTFNDDTYPSCLNCFKDNLSLFMKCAEKTVVVHKSCHHSLHRKEYLVE